MTDPLQRDFWVHSRTREGATILKKVGVNILGSLAIGILLEG